MILRLKNFNFSSAGVIIMRKSNYFLLFIMVLIIVFCPTMSVLAFEEEPDQLLEDAPDQFYYPNKDAVVWKSEQVFDYTQKPYQSNHYRVIKVFNQKGAKKNSQLRISYSPYQHKIKITTALLIKPSGDVINLPPTQIKDRAVGSTNNRLYQSQREKILQFSKVEAGSILVYAYQKQFKKLLIPGEIQILTAIEGQESEVILKVPQNRDINTKINADSNLNDAVISRQGEMKKYTWSGYQAQGKIRISTLDSWAEFSNKYQKLITDQGELNSALKEKVKSLTVGLDTRLKKIKALYNYTAEEINYLDYKFGVNGYRPLAATKIYKYKYAVAKDKVFFLLSLLKEIGINAEPVLINRYNNFTIDIVVADFNHMLLYLPQQDIYLDPTSGFVRYGNLTLSDQGQQVLNLAQGSIDQTPILAKKQNQEITKEIINLDKNGQARIKLMIKTEGFYDFIAKAVFGELSTIGQREIIVNILTKYFNELKLERLNIKQVNNLSKLSQFDLVFDVRDYYKRETDKIIIRPNQLPLSFLLSITEAKNTLPARIRKELIIKLPTDYKKVILPEDKTVENPAGRLTINYRHQNREVIINVDYQFNRLAAVEEVKWNNINKLLKKYQNIQESKIILAKKLD